MMGVAVASAGPHMQIICILLQTDNHASTSPLSFHRPDALPAAQPTEMICNFLYVFSK